MENISDMFTRGGQRLIHDTHYVAYVFKKTEKICNAVYFISSHISDISQGHGTTQTDIVREVEGSALALLRTVQATLSHTRDELPTLAPNLSISILELSSKLSTLAATGKLSREHFLVFQQELDTLERAIYFYEPERVTAPPKVRTKITPHIPPPQKKERGVVEKKILLPEPQKDTGTRSKLIKDILLKAPASSIKDISRGFPNVSEKTVQREVNLLIELGAVRKEGEKRWSRYSLVS